MQSKIRKIRGQKRLKNVVGKKVVLLMLLTLKIQLIFVLIFRPMIFI